MDFLTSISRLAAELEREGIRFALIGGLAMALRGVERATFDADFILMLEDLPRAHVILSTAGYTREFHSENVSHYFHPASALARVDILHAFRGPSLGMLQRAQRLPLAPGCALPVVQVEDLIGLKVQALVNNPDRALGDWNDIYRLVSFAGGQKLPLKWDLLADYLMLFRLEAKLPELQRLYGPIN